GVVDLVVDSRHTGSDSINHDAGGGDRDRSLAHHIIDIQEDLGINFRGAEDEAVNRIMEYEERDRLEKLIWEQGQVNQ
ncbi:hypothetical protein A2U01_0083827, partial [Trifolium medium]|nr:hypothetical protein [Trifolium medium]